MHLSAGPVAGRSPADPYFDPFWAHGRRGRRCRSSFHIGDAGYSELFGARVGRGPEPERAGAVGVPVGVPARRPADHGDVRCAHLRQPLRALPQRARVVSIENGSDWVDYLLHAARQEEGHGTARSVDRRLLVGATERRLQASTSTCRRIPRTTCSTLVDLIGAEHVLFGSDYPHPEGFAEPNDFARLLDGLDAPSVRRIMRSNTSELLGLPRDRSRRSTGRVPHRRRHRRDLRCTRRADTPALPRGTRHALPSRADARRARRGLRRRRVRPSHAAASACATPRSAPAPPTSCPGSLRRTRRRSRSSRSSPTSAPTRSTCGGGGVVSQAIDQRAFLAPVTKWVARVQRADSFDDMLAHALRVATTGRPGPVVLEIPDDVFSVATRRPAGAADARRRACAALPAGPVGGRRPPAARAARAGRASVDPRRRRRRHEWRRRRARPPSPRRRAPRSPRRSWARAP